MRSDLYTLTQDLILITYYKSKILFTGKKANKKLYKTNRKNRLKKAKKLNKPERPQKKKDDPKVDKPKPEEPKLLTPEEISGRFCICYTTSASIIVISSLNILSLHKQSRNIWNIYIHSTNNSTVYIIL